MSAARLVCCLAAAFALGACNGGAPEAAPATSPAPASAPAGERPSAPTLAPTPTPVSPTVAEDLIARTASALPRWADVGVARAEGFRSIGDAFTGFEHLVHPVWAADAVVLDPERPESLVYRVTDAGHELVSAMFMLPPGTTMADVPDLGDERAVWHTHDDLCFSREGVLAGRLVDGVCRPGGVHVPTPPMMHVWIVPHPCGPFAPLEGHGGSCEHEHSVRHWPLG